MGRGLSDRTGSSAALTTHGRTAVPAPTRGRPQRGNRLESSALAWRPIRNVLVAALGGWSVRNPEQQAGQEAAEAARSSVAITSGSARNHSPMTWKSASNLCQPASSSLVPGTTPMTRSCGSDASRRFGVVV